MAVAVLSGNRNFEGRIHSDVRANYLASPPLVVAYALAGRIDIDLQNEPLGTGKDGQPVYLQRHLADAAGGRGDHPARPARRDVPAASTATSSPATSAGTASTCRRGTPTPGTRSRPTSASRRTSRTCRPSPRPVEDIHGARVLGLLGDSITTDHISPAGSIKASSPAGKYLLEHGVPPKDFNSYGARRGNHEVMMRGTFANVRLRNRLVPEIEGGFTCIFPCRTSRAAADLRRRHEVPGRGRAD